MRTTTILALSLLLPLPVRAAEPTVDSAAFVPIFDGRSVAGWEGNMAAFRIQDGAVVGGQLDKRVPRNEYLCTQKSYRDFELRLKFRLLGENVNGGVQFRSERVPNSNEMIGYQADMGQTYWGCLYDERRHNSSPGRARRNSSS